MAWRVKFPPGRGSVLGSELTDDASPELMLDAVLKVGYEDREIPYALRLQVLPIIRDDPKYAIAMLENYFAKPRRAEARRSRSAAFKKARRRHGARSGSIGREQPAWQRRGGNAGGLRSRILAAMDPPRARGQL